MTGRLLIAGAVVVFAAVAACTSAPTARWERDNPLRPIPKAPLGLQLDLTKLPDPPTPARVRLGRWLFFDRRLSDNGTISCASCHQPQYAFSERTPVATGIGGHLGRRKALPIINLQLQYRHVNFRREITAAFFWDGRANSLEQQALQPIANPDEMGSSEARMVGTLSSIRGYGPYFAEAFGDARITAPRVARALADYERTRVSGNSPYDRWASGHQPDAISASAKIGVALFNGRAECGHCHGANGLTGGGFHDTGIGWDPQTRTFADLGHNVPTKGTVVEDWPGTFKAPTLREVARHPPYMHDGSIATLHDVVEFYNRGAHPNPYIDGFIHPLGLSPREVDAIVDFLKALNGEGWQDNGPSTFPQ